MKSKISISTFLIIAIVFKVFSQTMDKNPIGHWKKEVNNVPYFSYHGNLPYETILKNNKKAVLHNDPYFLLGNYKFKIFTHVSGEYEIFSPERVLSHFNKKENTSATITINEKEHKLTGLNSIAANSEKTSRNFGLGYAEYTYSLPNNITLKRVFSVAPSETINTGISGVLLNVVIANNGNKKATINYSEAILVAYDQVTYYDKKALSYTAKFKLKEGLVKVDFEVNNKNDHFPLPTKNEKSGEEFYPPSFFVKALNTITKHLIEENNIKSSSSFTIKPGEQKNLAFVIGYALNQTDSEVNVICDTLQKVNYTPIANTEHVKGAFVNNWKAKLMLFDEEKDQDLKLELIWHNYSYEKLATYSHYFKETFIPQGTMYFFSWGLRAAPRDHLQHALAACYSNPELAKSILRYTLKKSYKNGNIPFQDKGYGHVTSKYMYTSDQELYFLFAISEYLRITKDYDFLKEQVNYFSSDETESVLKRMSEYYRYFKEEVGTGPKGLVKLRNSDWNDLVFYKLDSKYNASFNSNESHMNTTMLVSFFDKLAAELKNAGENILLADEKEYLHQFATDLTKYRAMVWEAFLKDHGDRTFAKRMHFAWETIGDDNMFLEPQGFLMQIEEYEWERKKALYSEIKNRIMANEKLGARQVEKIELSEEFFGTRENGGFWYSLNGPLVIGLSTWNTNAAWDLFHKQTLKHQAKQFPNYWTSYWTSFDALDSSILPSEGLRAQHRFPANMKTTHCAHIHAWLVYEYCYLKSKVKK